MNKKIIALSATAMLLAMPLVGLAATFNPGPQPNVVATFSINNLIDLMFSVLWPIVVAFAIIMFVLAGLQFFTAQGDPDKIKSARDFVLWGVVGMVVALLAFSIPFIVRNTLGNGI